MTVLPQLDHFNGQTVTGLDLHEITDEAGKVWSLNFQGGSVHNFDPTVPAPSKDVIGLSLLRTTLSAGQTELHLGQMARSKQTGQAEAVFKEIVLLRPMSYAVETPALNGGWHFPQRDVNDPIQNIESVFSSNDPDDETQEP